MVQYYCIYHKKIEKAESLKNIGLSDIIIGKSLSNGSLVYASVCFDGYDALIDKSITSESE